MKRHFIIYNIMEHELDTNVKFATKQDGLTLHHRSAGILVRDAYVHVDYPKLPSTNSLTCCLQNGPSSTASPSSSQRSSRRPLMRS